MAQRTGVPLMDKMFARETWAKKKWPQTCIGKIAGGLTAKMKGLLTAYVVQGKPQWSRVYEPRQVTDQDEQHIKKIRTKMRALNRQLAKLEAGAYERGYPVNIDLVVDITNQREAR